MAGVLAQQFCVIAGRYVSEPHPFMLMLRSPTNHPIVVIAVLVVVIVTVVVIAVVVVVDAVIVIAILVVIVIPMSLLEL